VASGRVGRETKINGGVGGDQDDGSAEQHWKSSLKVSAIAGDRQPILSSMAFTYPYWQKKNWIHNNPRRISLDLLLWTPSSWSECLPTGLRLRIVLRMCASSITHSSTGTRFVEIVNQVNYHSNHFSLHLERGLVIRGFVSNGKIGRVKVMEYKNTTMP